MKGNGERVDLGKRGDGRGGLGGAVGGETLIRIYCTKKKK